MAIKRQRFTRELKLQVVREVEAMLRFLPVDSTEYRIAYWLLCNPYLKHGLEEKGLAALGQAEATLFVTEWGLQAFEAGEYEKAVRAWQSTEVVCQRRGLIREEEENAATSLYAYLGLIWAYRRDYDAAVLAYRSYLA